MECDSKEHALGTNSPKDELASGKRAKRLYSRPNIWTNTDVLWDAQVVSELDNTERSAEQEMVDKGDAVEIGASEEIVREPDASLKKRKNVELDINPSGVSGLTADTPKRRQSEQGCRAEKECTSWVYCGSQQAIV